MLSQVFFNLYSYKYQRRYNYVSATLHQGGTKTNIASNSAFWISHSTSYHERAAENTVLLQIAPAHHVPITTNLQTEPRAYT